jgi:hypothetical protein
MLKTQDSDLRRQSSRRPRLQPQFLLGIEAQFGACPFESEHFTDDWVEQSSGLHFGREKVRKADALRR